MSRCIHPGCLNSMMASNQRSIHSTQQTLDALSWTCGRTCGPFLYLHSFDIRSRKTDTLSSNLRSDHFLLDILFTFSLKFVWLYLTPNSWRNLVDFQKLGLIRSELEVWSNYNNVYSKAKVLVNLFLKCLHSKGNTTSIFLKS